MASLPGGPNTKAMSTTVQEHSGVQELYTGMYVTQRHYGLTLTHHGGMRLILLYSSVETSQLVHSGVQELYTGIYVTQRHYGLTLTHHGGL